MKNKVYKIKSNVLKPDVGATSKRQCQTNYVKRKDMEHFLLACDYKTSKIKVKIEENQKGIHLPPWLDDPPPKKKNKTSCFCNQQCVSLPLGSYKILHLWTKLDDHNNQTK